MKNFNKNFSSSCYLLGDVTGGQTGLPISTTLREKVMKEIRPAELVRSKGGLRMVRWLLQTTRIINGGHISKSDVKVAKAFSRSCYKLCKSQNTLKHLVLYLKGCATLLQQQVAGQRLDNSHLLGVTISRTRAGLPRIIPRQQRELIRRGSVKDIQKWLSFLSIYRVLPLVGKSSVETILHGAGLPFELTLDEEFRDIYWQNIKSRQQGLVLWSEVKNLQPKAPLRVKYLAQFKSRPQALMKSSPTASGFGVGGTGLVYASYYKEASSSYRSLLLSAAIMLRTKNILASYRVYDKFFGAGLLPILTTAGTEVLAARDKEADCTESDFFGRLKPPFYLGKLGFKQEPAGKMRVFAMVLPWVQWAFKPLHVVLFSCLENIATDGTFDQIAPIDNLLKINANRSKKGNWAASYDLSAATDCLPMSLQKWLLGPLLPEAIVEAWSDLLVGYEYKARSFLHPHLPKAVRYGVGQPMGALSSWAMLAITHHYLIQYAYYKTYGKTDWFQHYAVLGDDMVIARDSKVGQAYLEVMGKTGVKIGLHKSVVSDNLTLEFAKKFWYRGQWASPLPIIELMMAGSVAPVALEMAHKWGSSLATLLHGQGKGYKVLGSLHCKLSKLSGRNRRWVVAYLYKTKSFTEWVTLHSAVGSKVRRNTMFLAAYGIRKLVLTTIVEADRSIEYLDGFKKQSAFANPKGSVHDLYRYLPRDLHNTGAMAGYQLFNSLQKQKVKEIQEIKADLQHLFNSMLWEGTMVNDAVVNYRWTQWRDLRHKLFSVNSLPREQFLPKEDQSIEEATFLSVIKTFNKFQDAFDKRTLPADFSPGKWAKEEKIVTRSRARRTKSQGSFDFILHGLSVARDIRTTEPHQVGMDLPFPSKSGKG